MPDTMKAVIKRKPAPGAEITTEPIPVPCWGEVLIRVRAASICGTDIHIHHWDPWAQARIKPPLIFGHECSGEVVETGEGVRSVSVGDHVSCETHLPCGICYQCRTGKMHICKNLRILGVDINGTFAEYIKVPEICCWKNHKDLSFEMGTIMEPFGNAVHTVMESNVSGKVIAVLGDGPIACFAIGVARAVGSCRIFNTGINPYRMELAKAMGADELLDATSTNVVDWIMENTEREGVDVVLDMVGSQETINDGLKIVKRGGTYTAFGIPSRIPMIDLAEGVIFKGTTILGINGRKMFETWYLASNLLRAGKVDPRPVITHTFALEDYAAAMATTSGRDIRCGKVVLIP